MSLYKQFRTDEKLEKEGIFLELGVTDDGKPILIRIARAGGANVAFAKTMEAKMKPYRRQLQTETLDSKVAEKILMEVYAATVVLGWENVTDEHGKELNFTPENCVKLFTDLPDLYAEIQQSSQKVALFRQMEREADSKN